MWNAAKPGITTCGTAIPMMRPRNGAITVLRSLVTGSVTVPSGSPTCTASPSLRSVRKIPPSFTRSQRER